jgi:hypothetical protein
MIMNARRYFSFSFRLVVVDIFADVKPQFSRSGFRGKGKNIVTKHDATLCGRQNAMKIMENVWLVTYFVTVAPDFDSG